MLTYCATKINKTFSSIYLCGRLCVTSTATVHLIKIGSVDMDLSALADALLGKKFSFAQIQIIGDVKIALESPFSFSLTTFLLQNADA